MRLPHPKPPPEKQNRILSPSKILFFPALKQKTLSNFSKISTSRRLVCFAKFLDPGRQFLSPDTTIAKFLQQTPQSNHDTRIPVPLHRFFFSRERDQTRYHDCYYYYLRKFVFAAHKNNSCKRYEQFLKQRDKISTQNWKSEYLLSAAGSEQERKKNSEQTKDRKPAANDSTV
jgi:hypothetical protein